MTRWEGAVRVHDPGGGWFSADVIELATDEAAYAEFDVSDVPFADRHLVGPGAIFHWTIDGDQSSLAFGQSVP